MKIRTKVFLFSMAVFGLLFFGISQIISKVETANFSKLENQESIEDISRVQAALAGRLDDLAVKLSDWSNWDDTYAFAQDGNTDYVESNLNDDSLIALRLNFIVIKNDAGDTVFKKYIAKNEAEEAFPQGLEEMLSESTLSLNPQGGEQKKISGIMNSSDGAFVVAIQSITTSDGSAEPRGIIAFGYAIDDDFVGALSKATVLKMDHATYEDALQQHIFSVAREKLSLSDPTYIENDPNQKVINGFVLASDVFGSPSVILRVQLPRDIHKIGLDNMLRVNILLVAMGILEIFIILLLFEFFVLRKIDKLADGVQFVGAKDNGEARLEIEGKDEFTQLSLEINRMLDALSAVKTEKRESDSRFMNIADMAPVMIWISDSENKIVYANKLLTEFLGKSEKELLGDAWRRVIHPEDAERVIETFASAAKKREALSVKYRVESADGTYHCIMVQATTRVTPQGVLMGYTGTAMDVTDSEEADLRRQNYIKEIERMNSSMIDRELKMMELKKEIAKLKQNII